jgi:hypothetical protein
MPERFGFACFLPIPKFPSPASVISLAAAAFPGRIGMPVEVTVLDVQSGHHKVHPWSSGEALLQYAPGPTELLFAYYTSLGNRAGRVCIGFGWSKAAARMTVSLPDMTIADQYDDIASGCVRLHGLCFALGVGCVVAAGGETNFDERHDTTAEALAAVLSPSSGAQWVATDAGSLLSGHAGFEMVCQAETTIVLRRI